jgi:predicted DNA-binding transcriptional regulator YafY
MPKIPNRKSNLSMLERVREIHRLIRRYTDNPQNSSLRVTDETLAEALHVSDRQIRRDRGQLELLIDEKDVERGHGGEEPALCFDKKLRSWKYTRGVDLSVWVGRLDDEELGALLVAQQALAIFSGMPLARHISHIFEEDAGGLVGNSRSALREEITNLVSFYPDGAGKIDHDHFATIYRGLLLSQQLEVSYRSKASAGAVSRVLHPYHLCCFRHQWRLIAFDSQHEEIRDFVVTPRRLLSVKLLNRSFKRPANFDAHEHLSRHKDTKVQTVKLRVARQGAHHILERNWYGLVECMELPAGGVEAVFRVGDEGEFMRFVLTFGSDCEVLEPAAFREKIHTEARKVLAQVDAPK